MVHDYPTDEPKPSMASEPAVAYGVAEEHRVISEEELSRCFTLEEFKQHMDDLVESTHNHDTGCVEHAIVIPRACSIKEAQRRSMTVEQFTSKLYAMVDEFYSTKA